MTPIALIQWPKSISCGPVRRKISRASLKTTASHSSGDTGSFCGRRRNPRPRCGFVFRAIKTTRLRHRDEVDARIEHSATETLHDRILERLYALVDGKRTAITPVGVDGAAMLLTPCLTDRAERGADSEASLPGCLYPVVGWPDRGAHEDARKPGVRSFPHLTHVMYTSCPLAPWKRWTNVVEKAVASPLGQGRSCPSIHQERHDSSALGLISYQHSLRVHCVSKRLEIPDP